MGQPGLELSDLVNTLPGWLYEANGVLHPRGSEYDVQYVVDGLPLTENRSPAFAPPFDADNIDSMRVLTANYPAEYGRKLGGIVEIITEKNVPSGLHGQLDINGGSFATLDSSAAVSYVRGRHRFSISGDGFHTERYLDPPVLANYTNRASAGGVSASYERDFSDRDRLRLSVRHDAVRLLVPNELVQEAAGQRQYLTNAETSGQIYFQHTISPDLFLSFSGSVRDAKATLASNSLATPVIVAQNRGYRQGYGRGDLAGHCGRHDWKVGVDSTFGPVHEQLHTRSPTRRSSIPERNNDSCFQTAAGISNLLLMPRIKYILGTGTLAPAYVLTVTVLWCMSQHGAPGWAFLGIFQR